MSKNRQNSKQNRKGEGMESVGVLLRWLATIFFIGITAVYPLYFPPNRYLTITENKRDLFVKFTVIIAVICVLALLYLLTQKKRLYVKNYFVADEPKRFLSIAEWAILFFIIWAFISALLSEYSDVVWYGVRDEGFIPLLCYVLTFFIIARFYIPKERHFAVFACGAIAVAGIGILQFFGHDFLNLFPYTKVFPDADGNMTYVPFESYGPLSAYFLTTLGNFNIVAAYSSLTTVLFAALFSTSKTSDDEPFVPNPDHGAVMNFIKSKKRIFASIAYLLASMLSFMLIVIAAGSADAGRLAIMGTMVLLLPYWLSNRQRLGKICIAVASWCVVYLWYNLYLAGLKAGLEAGSEKTANLAINDVHFLTRYEPESAKIIGAVTAVMVVLVLGGLFLLFGLKKWAEKPMKIAGVALLAVVIVGGVAFVEVAGRQYENQPNNLIWEARETLHGRLDDNFGSNRGWVWKQAVEVIPENPVFGTGPDTFLQALGSETQAEAMARYGVHFDKPHNTFLQIAVCLGIPALFAYLVFLLGLFIPAVKKAFSRPVLLAFGAGALSYVIQSLFCVEVPIVSPLLWIALGVMAGELWRDKVGCDVIEF